jgi:hypothetical protein
LGEDVKAVATVLRTRRGLLKALATKFFSFAEQIGPRRQQHYTADPLKILTQFLPNSEFLGESSFLGPFRRETRGNAGQMRNVLVNFWRASDFQGGRVYEAI